MTCVALLVCRLQTRAHGSVNPGWSAERLGQRCVSPALAAHSTVILGLGPRIHSSKGVEPWNWRDTRQRGIQVGPMRVGALDEVDLPIPLVVLERLLALDRLVDV